MTEPQRDQIRSGILRLLDQRATTASICPSEVARAEFPDRWRERMEPVRQVARAMADAGEIEICQRGEAIDPGSEIRGPIRLRLRE